MSTIHRDRPVSDPTLFTTRIPYLKSSVSGTTFTSQPWTLTREGIYNTERVECDQDRIEDLTTDFVLNLVCVNRILEIDRVSTIT